MKKIIGLLIAVTALSITALLSGCGTEIDLPPVINQADIQPAASLSHITVSGVVESVTSRNIYSTLGLIVDHVYVEVGDTVTEGQALGTLDNEILMLNIAQLKVDLEMAHQNRQEAERNLRNSTNPHVLNARAALSAAEANLVDVQRSYDNALSDFNDRNNAQVLGAESELRNARLGLETIETAHESLVVLHRAGAISQHEFRQSENALAAAQSRYRDAVASYDNVNTALRRNLDQLGELRRAAVDSRRLAQETLSAATAAASQEADILGSAVAGMEISLQILQRQLEDSLLKAPVSGVVTAVLAREGSIGSGLLFVIEDTDNLRIKTRVREYDIGRIHEGMEVTITSDATGNNVHKGIINRISPAAVQSPSPIVEFEVEVDVVSENTGLRIGMNVRVGIDLE